MRRILAVVDLTVKESLRKRVFLALVCFTILILSVTAVLPAQSPEARVHLAQSWCLKSVSFFSILIAVFLSGASLPADVEDRKLFTLLTKPLTRTELILGKFLGFMAVMVAFLAAMGLVTAAFVRGVAAWSAGSDARFLSTYVSVPARQFVARPPVGKGVAADAYVQVFTGEDGKTAVSMYNFTDRLALWNFGPEDWEGWGGPVAGEIALQIQQREAESGLEMDDEHDHHHGAGAGHDPDHESHKPPVPSAAKKQGPGMVPLFVSFSEIELSFVNPETGVGVARRITLKHKKAAEFTIPPAVLKGARTLQVYVRCAHPLREVTCRTDSCVLIRPQASFESNLLRSLALSLSVVVVLVAATVAVSTVVSGPVAIFFGIFLFAVGQMHGFIAQSVKSVETQVEMLEHGQHGHGEGDDIPGWLMSGSAAVSRAAITVLPDLTNFDGSEFVIHQRVIPADMVRSGTAYAGAYGALMIVLALIFFRLREFR